MDKETPCLTLGLSSFIVRRDTMEAMLARGYICGYILFMLWVHCQQGLPMKLTDAQIKRLKTGSSPHKVSDGGGLFLWVTPSGGKI
jgi:hypothetical protein